MKMTKTLENIQKAITAAAENNGWTVEFEFEASEFSNLQFLTVRIDRDSEFGTFMYSKRGACKFASGIHCGTYTPCEKVKKSQGKNLAWWMNDRVRMENYKTQEAA